MGEKRDEKAKEEQEVAQILEEEGEVVMDEEEKRRLQEEQVRQLTGLPLEIDQMNFAIPVCAPYAAVMNYRFKVKVTPGNDKCGKAVKSTMQIFEKTAARHELEYVKAVS